VHGCARHALAARLMGRCVCMAAWFRLVYAWLRWVDTRITCENDEAPCVHCRPFPVSACACVHGCVAVAHPAQHRAQNTELAPMWTQIFFLTDLLKNVRFDLDSSKMCKMIAFGKNSTKKCRKQCMDAQNEQKRSHQPQTPVEPPIDLSSTSHRPLIDPSSTSHRPHRPLIDLSSTSHRPLIDLSSTS
jgi:hypothetical protein